MFDVLVFVYENYWRGDAYPDFHQLERKLSAHGFEADEIQQALVWLDGLNLAAEGTPPPESQEALAHQPSPGAMRVYSVNEQDKLGAQCLGFIVFLESSGVLPPLMREIVVDRAVAASEAAPMSLDALKLIVLMVYWRFGHEPDALILDELTDETEGRRPH